MIDAPKTGETPSPKLKNNVFITWGPSDWSENRTDGTLMSIDVTVKGWLKEDIPVKSAYFRAKTEFGNEEGAIYPYKSGETAPTSASFNWPVPAELRTTATYHNNLHPHNTDNDDIYLPLLEQWTALIKDTSDFTTAMDSVKTQLDSL
jgi:hypothetical protein|tara:strand:- start:2587 stop:3030 length:444 start_codon:yes stop_codon:yes gene_type:complete